MYVAYRTNFNVIKGKICAASSSIIGITKRSNTKERKRTFG